MVNCVRGNTNLRAVLLLYRDLDTYLMTLKLDRDIDILKMHLYTGNEVVRSSHSKVIA